MKDLSKNQWIALAFALSMLLMGVIYSSVMNSLNDDLLEELTLTCVIVEKNDTVFIAKKDLKVNFTARECALIQLYHQETGATFVIEGVEADFTHKAWFYPYMEKQSGLTLKDITNSGILR